MEALRKALFCTVYILVLTCFHNSVAASGYHCELYPIPVHGVVTTPCSRLPGHSCRLTCDRGYNLIGSAIRWCKSDGTWTGTQPRCYGSYHALDVSCNSPCLLVATDSQIIALDYNNATIYPIISNLSLAASLWRKAYAIDYHYSLGYIFWSDFRERNIKRSNINGTDIKVLHNTTDRCFGLAVDWRSSQLYWTDSSGTISVSDLDGNSRRVLLSRLYLYGPIGIVLDPERGLMFWTDSRGLKKSTLNGTQVVTLAKYIRWPGGIDLDRQNKLVFWFDRGLRTVESIDYDGNNRKLLYRTYSSHFHGLTFLSSYLFFSYPSTRTSRILKLNASSGTFTSCVPLLGPVISRGLVAYDRSRQLPVITCPSLPAPSNGTRLGCPGNATVYYGTICQFSCNNGYIGSGSQVRRCQENGTWSGIDFTCQTLDVLCNSPCLLVATEKEIIAVDYNNATIYPIISNLSRAVAIDYHYSLGYIFWSDYQERDIKRSNINGTDIKILHNTSGECYGLAVDWRSSQLYWVESEYGIFVSDLDGNNKRRVLRIPIYFVDNPGRIVLDPERGLMFWTDNHFRVKKSTLNGTQIVTLVNQIQQPSSIDLDRQNKLVFWVDEGFGTVESIDYDGNNRKLLYRSLSSHFQGVTFFSSYLFVSYPSSRTSGILKLNASGGTFTSFVPLLGPGRPRGLVTYDSFRQLPAVTCPTLSTPTNGVLLGCDTTEMLYNTVCRFSCESGSQASGSTARRCTDNGTWSGTDLVCTGAQDNRR